MTRHLSASALFTCSSLVSGALLLAAPAAAMSAAAQDFTGGQAFASPAPAPDSASADYANGTKALDQQRWQDAITSFDKAAKSRDKRADAALYWKAYALNKLGRTGLVSATCDQLQTTYPRSTWNHDCSALIAAAADPGIFAGEAGATRHAIHPTPQPNDNGIFLGRTPNRLFEEEQLGNLQGQLRDLRNLHIEARPFENPDAGSDADLKMLALNSLMQREPAQALPMVRNILTGNGSPQLKQRAVTALSMSQSPDAQALLRDVATGKIQTTEQRQAIQMLGAYQGKRAAETLAEIYRSSTDRNLKRAALSGLFISGDAQRLVDLARNEKDLQLKHDIVAHLALMQDKAATDYMLDLLK